MSSPATRPVRLAWFSPVPPVRSGVATNSAELIGALTAVGQPFRIDVFVDEPVAQAVTMVAGTSARVASAHEFVWRHRKNAYDLTVYQLGNSSHHNYLWPYLFRYPGLVVLHDAQLHHARAAALLTERRTSDYRLEFAANHPQENADLAEVAIAGFDTHLYYMWPMTRLVVESARAVAVHSPAIAAHLREPFSGAASRPLIESISLSQGVLIDSEREARARREIRGRHGIPAEAVVFGIFGGLTPEKRVPQVLDAIAATRSSIPSAHLLLAGAPAAHFDVATAARERGLADRVTLTGYIDTDDELTDAVAACDVSVNLRWPTAREVSGPWLRALAAGKPTIITDLAHAWEVPSLDPRTWRENGPFDSRDPAFAQGGGRPIAVSIDILDEDHSLRLAIRRLAADAALRASLGDGAREYWRREHSLERSVADYGRLIEQTMNRPAPRPPLPAHLVNSGDRTLRRLLEPYGLGGTMGSGKFEVGQLGVNVRVDFEDTSQR